jgi:hypothetical protein
VFDVFSITTTVVLPSPVDNPTPPVVDPPVVVPPVVVPPVVDPPVVVPPTANPPPGVDPVAAISFLQHSTEEARQSFRSGPTNSGPSNQLSSPAGDSGTDGESSDAGTGLSGGGGGEEKDDDGTKTVVKSEFSSDDGKAAAPATVTLMQTQPGLANTNPELAPLVAPADKLAGLLNSGVLGGDDNVLTVEQLIAAAGPGNPQAGVPAQDLLKLLADKGPATPNDQTETPSTEKPPDQPTPWTALVFAAVIGAGALGGVGLACWRWLAAMKTVPPIKPKEPGSSPPV